MQKFLKTGDQSVPDTIFEVYEDIHALNGAVDY
jgi:hypothetical protein